MAMFREPVVLFDNARVPKAQLNSPEVFILNALFPKALLKPPALFVKVSAPNALLLCFEFMLNALLPNPVL